MEIKYRSEYIFEYEALEATVISEEDRRKAEAILDLVIKQAQREAKPLARVKTSDGNTKYYLTNSYR